MAKNAGDRDGRSVSESVAHMMSLDGATLARGKRVALGQAVLRRETERLGETARIAGKLGLDAFDLAGRARRQRVIAKEMDPAEEGVLLRAGRDPFVVAKARAERRQARAVDLATVLARLDELDEDDADDDDGDEGDDEQRDTAPADDDDDEPAEDKKKREKKKREVRKGKNRKAARATRAGRTRSLYVATSGAAGLPTQFVAATWQRALAEARRTGSSPHSVRDRILAAERQRVHDRIVQTARAHGADPNAALHRAGLLRRVSVP